jgi:hypothetical protein
MRLSQLTRAFHFRDGHVFVRLYKEVLEKVQKWAVKMVSGLKGSTYIERLKEVGLLTLEERRHQADKNKIVTGKTW